MLKKYEKVSYELLRPEQVKQIQSKCPIVYIPAGSLEWHSFQNPLGTDSLKAHAVCCEAALNHGGIVLPPYYLGLLGMHNWGPKDWDGYTLGFNEEDVFLQAMTNLCTALVHSNWKVLVGVTGHDVDEQRNALKKAIDIATKNKDATGFAVFEGQLHTPNDDISLTMDHAAAWETSCMMYCCPNSVDLSKLEGKDMSDIEENIYLPDKPTGMTGKNPLEHASGEMGKKIIEKMGDLIGGKASKMLKKIEEI